MYLPLASGSPFLLGHKYIDQLVVHLELELLVSLIEDRW